MPKLLDQARDTIRLRHYSIRTEESYIGWMKRYILFHNKRHPAQMGEPEVTAFLSHLAVDRQVSSSTQNQALAALLFLYKEVLKQPLEWLDNIQRAKKPERLPLVFTREEVRSILMHLEGSKWIVGSLLYGAGLRLLECLRLRIKDIDFGYNQIVVRDGKGAKDRITVLPGIVREPLRHHLVKVKALHELDLREGFGQVYLPDALARKYPNAPREAYQGRKREARSTERNHPKSASRPPLQPVLRRGMSCHGNRCRRCRKAFGHRHTRRRDLLTKPRM